MLTEDATILLWITGGSLFNCKIPDAATVLGLARSVMLERPSLKMPVLDLEKGSASLSQSCKNAVLVLNEVIRASNPDLEYREHNGALYISRFIPDIAMNQAFRQTQDAEKAQKCIADVGHARLNVRAAGQVDTLRFEEVINQPGVKPGYVRIEVQAVGMNAKDLHAINDRINMVQSTCGLDISGIVIAIGSTTSKFVFGDRVVVMAPHNYGTVEDVPEWACCKLRDDENSAVMATIPIVFSTALYALEHRARCEEGQSVLVHSGAGGLGIAAIQVARMLGAEVFATVGTKEKKEFLVETFNIPEKHIFDSHSISFVADLLDVTSGRGVDIVLNSLTGDLLHGSWEVLAPFGTFVELGKRDIVDSGRLNMRAFQRATTFTAFDLTDLFWSTSKTKNRVWSRYVTIQK